MEVEKENSIVELFDLLENNTTIKGIIKNLKSILILITSKKPVHSSTAATELKNCGN
jgi:hypothetical protein